jgi:phage tail P2-like protein
MSNPVRSHDALLPPNQTHLESALSLSMMARVNPDALLSLINPLTCPINLLPYLAWALSVDEWDDAWMDDVKRQVVFDSVTVHRQKGTKASVLRALAAAGYPLAQVDENRHGYTRNGQCKRDAWPTRGEVHPFVYRVRLNGLINYDQTKQVLRILSSTVPARCHLHSLNFADASLLHNGFTNRNSEYSRGVIYV